MSSLAELRMMPKTRTNAITKDELIDSILSAVDVDVGGVVHLKEKLATFATELGEITRSIASSETATQKIMEMVQKIDKQTNIIMQQQRFLENIDQKNRETNLVVLGVPDDALDGATNDDCKLCKIWVVIHREIRWGVWTLVVLALALF